MRRSLASAIAVVITAVAGACSVPPATSQPQPSPIVSPATPFATAPWASSSLSPSRPGLPALPAGLPVMPGARAADPVPGVIARWTIDAIGPEVYRYYLDALPAAGFVIRGRYPGGDVAIIRFGVDDGTTLDLALVGEGAGSSTTRIDLVLPDP